MISYRKSLLMVGAASIMLVGCSSEPNKIAEKGTAMPPPAAEAKIASQPKGLNLGSPTTAPLKSPAIPPATKVAVRDGDDLTPNPAPRVEASEKVAQQAIDTAPANQKPNVEARIANLEAQLAALRADYDQIVPTFKTLSVNTDRLVLLMDQMEGKAASSVTPAAGPQMAAGSSHGTSVKDVRFGIHPDKTRIVMDVSSITGYDIDIDNAENVMVITLPQADWKAEQETMNLSSDIVQSWSAQESPNGGSIIAVQLNKSVKVTGQNALPASGSKGPRIYVDISAL